MAGELGIVLTMMMIFGYPATAQTGCTSTLMGLAPCLNYVTGSSSTPSTSCCSQLATVVQSQPQCLCALLNANASSSLGLSINQTLALQLPGVCNVQTPPVSRCNGANGPATSPAMSPPDDSSNQTPEAQDSPSFPRSGSKTVPTTATSNTCSLRTHLTLTLFVIFIASRASSVIHF